MDDSQNSNSAGTERTDGTRISEADAFLITKLGWLADAPLFIDEKRIERFYDAVVHPAYEQREATLQLTEQVAERIRKRFDLTGSVSLGFLGNLFTGLSPQISGGYGRDKEHTKGTQEAKTVTLVPIRNAQRQLEELVLHYLIKQQNRLFLVDDPSQQDWRAHQSIREVPRALAFLDFPGEAEARNLGVPTTKLIPMAAEFGDSMITLLYNRLGRKSGEAQPEYPGDAEQSKKPPEKVAEERKKYWQWFDRYFDPQEAMEVLSEAATAANGSIRWIDYRVPLRKGGETLHLHLTPAGQFNTGEFAYNFIRRGYDHGLRLIGTLKSEPDMDVLAVYEK